MKQGAFRPASTLADFNKQRVVDAVKEAGALSRTDLAHRLKLSKPTISKIVQELLADGILVEAGVAESTGGKRAILLRFNARAYYVIGIVVDKDSIDFALSTSDATIVEQYRLRLDPAEPIQEQLANGINKFLSLKPPKQVVRIVIGMSGSSQTVDVSAVSSVLESRFGISVLIDDPVNMAAVGELHKGLAKGIERFAYLHIGEKLSLAFVAEGRIVPSSPLPVGKMVLGGEPSSWRSIDDYLSASDGSDLPQILALTAYNIHSLLSPQLIILAGDYPLELAERTIGQYESSFQAACPLKSSSLQQRAILIGCIFSALTESRYGTYLSPLMESILE